VGSAKPANQSKASNNQVQETISTNLLTRHRHQKITIQIEVIRNDNKKIEESFKTKKIIKIIQAFYLI